jgi:integrase
METGLRPSEACALVCKDVNVVAGILSVERTFTSNRLKKTTKQNRKGIIPLSDRAKEIAERNVEGKGLFGYLFVNPRTDNHYLGDTLGRIWRNHSGTGVTLYEATRHSFASQLIEDNDAVLVRDLLRQSDIRSTVRYAHVRMRKLREVVNNRRKAVVG